MEEDLQMLEPRKRTAIDGKVWWCAFDTETMKYNMNFGKHKLKKNCQSAIDRWMIQRIEISSTIRGY